MSISNIEKPDNALCTIIAAEMELDPSRVVVYNQNFKAPSDTEIYIIVAKRSVRIVGSKNEPDPDTDEEIKSVILNETYDVEITSKNTDAKMRAPEIIMALTSSFSVQIQEEGNFKISRTSDILDLSFISGPSALHRYRIPVIIDRVMTKRTSIEMIDKFQTPEVLSESN